MLEPAQLHMDAITKEMVKRWYDLEYQYYDSGTGRYVYWTESGESDQNKRFFASVDGEGNLLGIISYRFDGESGSCFNFGIMAFQKFSRTYICDIKQAVCDIFFKYHFKRMEWLCYDANPAAKGYDRFIKKYGGRKAGHLRQASKLLDGKFHDCTIYEILVSDLLLGEDRIPKLLRDVRNQNKSRDGDFSDAQR